VSQLLLGAQRIHSAIFGIVDGRKRKIQRRIGIAFSVEESPLHYGRIRCPRRPTQLRVRASPRDPPQHFQLRLSGSQTVQIDPLPQVLQLLMSVANSFCERAGAFALKFRGVALDLKELIVQRCA
jgi:hypothetical protein